MSAYSACGATARDAVPELAPYDAAGHSLAQTELLPHLRLEYGLDISSQTLGFLH